MTLVYSNNSTTKKEILTIIPFKIAEKTLKYLGINLSKEMEDFYDENYKTPGCTHLKRSLKL